MLGIRFIKSQPTVHLMQFRGGQLVREGAGQSFYYFGPTTTLTSVSVGNCSVDEVLHGVKADNLGGSFLAHLVYEPRAEVLSPMETSQFDHLTAGRLVQLLPQWSPNYSGLCLYYPANRHPPTALRLFVQAVREWVGGEGGGG